MRVGSACLLAAVAALAFQTERDPGSAPAAQPGVEESFLVSGEHPLLFLTSQRIRLLRRERERQSERWKQFDALMTGHAAMPEPGFALALYYQVAGDAEAGRRAVEWALSTGSDLRQLALVFDWCQPLLGEAQSAALAAKLQRAVETLPRTMTVSEARSRVLAAMVLYGRAPKISERELERVVRNWWRGEIVAAVKSGHAVIPRADTYALFEMLHAVRDNLNIDLRESLPTFFKQLPLYHLLSYYPAVYQTPENEYRIPAVKGAEPDLALAAVSRAADLSMVAFDNNAPQNQYVQGWAMHDRFLLRGAFGIPYEFLWANPYQPGLSYYNLPLSMHDGIFGRVFARARWDDDAVWIGYFDGQLQTFSEGEATIHPLASATEPLQLGDTAVVAASRFSIKAEATTVYVVGLAPSRIYNVEPDDEEFREGSTDPGGILELDFPGDFRGGIRLRLATAQ
jgi:hypothetical protein